MKFECYVLWHTYLCMKSNYFFFSLFFLLWKKREKWGERKGNHCIRKIFHFGLEHFNFFFVFFSPFSFLFNSDSFFFLFTFFFSYFVGFEWSWWKKKRWNESSPFEFSYMRQTIHNWGSMEIEIVPLCFFFVLFEFFDFISSCVNFY